MDQEKAACPVGTAVASGVREFFSPLARLAKWSASWWSRTPSTDAQPQTMGIPGQCQSECCRQRTPVVVLSPDSESSLEEWERARVAGPRAP